MSKWGLALAHRCEVCHGLIWPWQRAKFIRKIGSDRIAWWHAWHD